MNESLYFIMGKKSKRCPKKCLTHSFLLKPVHYSANFSRELSASFCPLLLVNPSITPKFNRDNRSYTSSFMLPVDDIKLKNNQEYYRIEHEKYKMENCQQKSNLMIAKPKSKSNYCNVCKIQYEDYLDHIKSEKHKIKINLNKFNSFIDQMCDCFQTKVKLQQIKHKDTYFMPSLQTSLSFTSQEIYQNEDKIMQKSCNSYFPILQYKIISDLLHSSRNFHPLHQQIEDNPHLQINQQNNDMAIQVAPFSPIKKYSQATQCIRSMSSVKPIIISGCNFLKMNQ